jgi:hypothetical protein
LITVFFLAILSGKGGEDGEADESQTWAETEVS